MKEREERGMIEEATCEAKVIEEKVLRICRKSIKMTLQLTVTHPNPAKRAPGACSAVSIVFTPRGQRARLYISPAEIHIR